MAKVVALVGSKGGSGKSTAAHLLAHGAGSLARAIPAVVMTTDPEERPLQDARRYLVVDARSSAQLVAEMRRLLQVDKLLIIMDGAAGRPDLDALVSEVADLAVVPFRAAGHDAERTVDTLARMPDAVALPMGWPRHPGTAKRARQWLRTIPEPRRLQPFPHIPRLDSLLSSNGYETCAYDLAGPARGLLLEVLARAGVDPDDLAPGRDAA